MIYRTLAPSFDEFTRDSLVLLCPRCNSNNLHQCNVEVWFRREEHGDGIHTTVKGLTSTVEPSPAKDCPGNRECLRIGFWCEHCSHETGRGGDMLPIHTLEIMQHKGVTLIQWVV